MRLDILFLKATILIFGCFVLAIYVLLLPVIASNAILFYPSFLVYMAFISIYISAIPFIFTLYHFIKLLYYIEINSLSQLAIKSLNFIKYSTLLISFLLLLAIPLLYFVADKEDAPGLILIGLIITFSPTVITVFASVIEKFLKD